MARIERLEMHISYECINDCVFCSEHNRLRSLWGVYPSLGEVKDNLFSFYKKGFKHVTFTGGEPTLNNDFIEILGYAKNLGYTTYATTNGYRFSQPRYTKNTLKLIDELCLSVHGHTAFLHNKHTANNSKSFEILNKAVDNIKKYNTATYILANCVVTRYNIDYLEEILDFIIQGTGAQHIMFSNFSPEGKGLLNFRDLVVPLEEIKSKIATLAKKAERHSKILRFFGLPACIFPEEYINYSNDFYWSPRVTLELKENSQGKLLATYSYKPTRARAKLDDCKSCKWKDSCAGIFEEYLKNNDISLIKPKGRIKSSEEIRERAAREKRLWLRLTKTCNNNCIYCLDADCQDGTVEGFDAIEKKLKEGIRDGYKRTVLSGGEPTVHPDFIKIIKTSRDLGYTHIQAITNGRMFFYKDFLNLAVEAGLTEATFTMSGHTQQLFERQTGVKGSFLQSLRGLMNALERKDLIISIDIVINKINVKHLREIVDFYVALGVKEFDLLQVVPFGRAWQNSRNVSYDIRGELPYLKKAFSLSKRKDIVLWTNRFPPQYLEGFEDLIQHPCKLYDEIGGRGQMFIDSLKDGKDMPCYGERCEFCFLSGFCKDLKELVTKKELWPKEAPQCLSGGRINTKEKEALKFSSGIDISTILSFYIDKRYFVKSPRCEICRCYNECSGASINYIRKNSFAGLKPILSIWHSI